jgi:hypothetical protein
MPTSAVSTNSPPAAASGSVKKVVTGRPSQTIRTMRALGPYCLRSSAFRLGDASRAASPRRTRPSSRRSARGSCRTGSRTGRAPATARRRGRAGSPGRSGEVAVGVDTVDRATARTSTRSSRGHARCRTSPGRHVPDAVPCVSSDPLYVTDATDTIGRSSGAAPGRCRPRRLRSRRGHPHDALPRTRPGRPRCRPRGPASRWPCRRRAAAAEARSAGLPEGQPSTDLASCSIRRVRFEAGASLAVLPSAAESSTGVTTPPAGAGWTVPVVGLGHRRRLGLLALDLVELASAGWRGPSGPSPLHLPGHPGAGQVVADPAQDLLDGAGRDDVLVDLVRLDLAGHRPGRGRVRLAVVGLPIAPEASSRSRVSSSMSPTGSPWATSTQALPGADLTLDGHRAGLDDQLVVLDVVAHAGHPSQAARPVSFAWVSWLP